MFLLLPHSILTVQNRSDAGCKMTLGLYLQFFFLPFLQFSHLLVLCFGALSHPCVRGSSHLVGAGERSSAAEAGVGNGESQSGGSISGSLAGAAPFVSVLLLRLILTLGMLWEPSLG